MVGGSNQMTKERRDRRNELARLRYAANPEVFKQRSRIGGAKRRAKNKEGIAAKAKIYRANNVEKRMAYQRKWRADNPDASAKYAGKARAKNPEVYNERTRVWRKANPDYIKKRIASDPEFRIVTCLRSRLLGCVRLAKAGKVSNALDLLGCSTEYFMKFIEKQWKAGMTWSNHGCGKGKWHLDHRKAVSHFNMLDEMDQRWCFHYSNLQPLWEPDNLKKSNKLNYTAKACATA